MEEKDKDGITSLHWPSRRGRIEVVKYLIEQCHANIEARDYRYLGRTPLECAPQYSHTEVAISYIIADFL